MSDRKQSAAGLEQQAAAKGQGEKARVVESDKEEDEKINARTTDRHTACASSSQRTDATSGKARSSSDSKREKTLELAPPVPTQQEPDVPQQQSNNKNRQQTLEILPPTLVPPRQDEDVGQIVQTAPTRNVEEQDDTMEAENLDAMFPGAYRVRGRAARASNLDNDNDEENTVWAPTDASSPAIPDARAIEEPDADEIQRIAMQEAERRIRQDTVVAISVQDKDNTHKKKKKWIFIGVVVVMVIALVAVGASLALTRRGRSTSNNLVASLSSTPTPVPSTQPSFAPSTSLVPTTSLTYPWVQLGQDMDGEAAGDVSGHSISLSADGMTVAIGAPENDANGINNAGHVRVHRYLDGSWVQLGQDIDDMALNGQSGFAVSMSANGNVVAIGAPNAYNGTGHVQVYRLEGEAWNQVGSDMNGTAVGDRFGYSISLSSDGNAVVVGADQDTSNLEGYVRVYQLDQGNWNQVGQTLVGEAKGARFGSSVSISADGATVAIGGLFYGPFSGRVRMYRLEEGGNWGPVGQDIYGEDALDQSGKSVALSANGTMVAIGAWFNHNDNGSYAGHVRVYSLHEMSWRQVGQDIDGKATNDQFGTSVALSFDGTFLAAGAFQYSDSLPGYTSVFQLVDGLWEPVGPDLNGEAAADEFGFSISMSGDGKTIAIGGPRNDANGWHSGHVRVYQLV